MGICEERGVISNMILYAEALNSRCLFGLFTFCVIKKLPKFYLVASSLL